jgi:hypothetical protein
MIHLYLAFPCTLPEMKKNIFTCFRNFCQFICKMHTIYNILPSSVDIRDIVDSYTYKKSNKWRGNLISRVVWYLLFFTWSRIS